MTPTRSFENSGQSLWLDSISRELLESGAVNRPKTIEERCT
jgi:hypothetical protein